MPQELNIFGQPVGPSVSAWTERPFPPLTPMPGRTCSLEPLDVERHAADLYAAYAEAPDGRDWTYMFVGPFAGLSDYAGHLRAEAAKRDPQHHAIIDAATGKPVGTAALMRIDPHARRHRGRPHHLLAAAEAFARRHRSDVPADDARVRRAEIPPLRMEMRQPQRALPPRGGTLRLCLRRHFSPSHYLQRPQSRHRLVRHDRSRLAACARGVRTLAGGGKFRPERRPTQISVHDPIGIGHWHELNWLGGGFSRYLVDLGGWPGWHISGDWPSAGFQAYYPSARDAHQHRRVLEADRGCRCSSSTC